MLRYGIIEVLKLERMWHIMEPLKLQLERITYQTTLLVSEANRLQNERKSFAFTKSFLGKKVFLVTCNGIQKNVFFIPRNDFDYTLLTSMNILISQSELLEFKLDEENQIIVIYSLSDEAKETKCQQLLNEVSHSIN